MDGALDLAFPLTRKPEYGMFEYACHEGNYGLRNALSASRAVEERTKPSTNVTTETTDHTEKGDPR